MVDIPQVLKDKFVDVYYSMEPENLSQDGELSRAEMDERLIELTARWDKLEAEAGCAVSEDEVVEWL